MNSQLSKGSVFRSGIGELKITGQIGKGKSAYSYSARLKERTVVLKLMHDESNPYYEFSGNKVELEVKAYRILKDLELNVPDMLFSSVEENYLVKEYIDGDTAAQKISESGITDEHIDQLFTMSNLAEKSGYNLDYFPTNFLVSNDSLFYIDYEINEFDPKWSLINWGIYYWANTEGFKEFLETANASKINSDVNNGIPVKEPFEKTIQHWKNKFSGG